MCFDAKFNFDDSAKFRQKDVFAMDDQSESDPREVEAGKFALNYIGLDGNIACLGKSVNGIYWTPNKRHPHPPLAGVFEQVVQHCLKCKHLLKTCWKCVESI